MADDKKETWLNWLAVTTIIFSACATFSTFKGGGMSTRAILEQNKASDSWSYYQAKSIKQHTYELQRDSLVLQSSDLKGERAAAYQEKIAKYSGEIERYKAEKDQVKKEAETHEATRTIAQKNGGVFGNATIYLQMAIVLSALAGLLKKKPLWYVGMAFGTLGLVYFTHALILINQTLK